MFSLEIPSFLSHLPVDEKTGYPIPYFVTMVDGKPDFRLLSVLKQRLCYEYKKCSICGKPLLKNSYFFISGILGMTNGVSSDAAMHRECAEFSLKACPHMYYEKAQRRETGEHYEKAKENEKLKLTALQKPTEIFLIHVEKIWIEKHPNDPRALLFRYNAIKKADSYIYKDNKLIKNDSYT